MMYLGGGGLKCTGLVLDPMKLTHLVKYMGFAKSMESTSLLCSVPFDP
jgi:hypothetical protein